MWDQPSFGGGGFDQGGGFLTSPGTFGTQGQEGRSRRSQADNNVMPCMAIHIHHIPEMDEHLKVGSLEATVVSIVGIVRSVDEQSTRVSYMIDDHSGPPLEVQRFDVDDEIYINDIRSSVIEGVYVRAIGSTKLVKGKRFLMAYSIAPLENANELTIHLLEVAHTRLAIQAMDNQGSLGVGSGGIERMDTMPSVNDEMGNMMMGLNKTQQLILQVISSDRGEHGISFSDICRALRSLNSSTIRNTVEFLSNEGHIYTTVDDDHYKATLDA